MDASAVRWRVSHYKGAKDRHEFAEGDRVVIARLSPHIPTTTQIIGHVGVITELDEMSMSSVEMRCGTCGGVHTMHEGELDYMGDALVDMVRHSAGLGGQLEMEPITQDEQFLQDIEDKIAVAMSAAGFLQPAVEDRAIPVCDPDLPQPHWSKYVYGTIWRLATFKTFHAALVDVARSVDGNLVEWASLSLQHGWQVITHDDLETLTLEMPIRASFQSRTNRDDTAYDEAKELATAWLQDASQIDIGAIFRAMRGKQWQMSDWSAASGFRVENSFRLTSDRHKSSEVFRDEFWEWAKQHWVWHGKYNVRLCALDGEALGLDIAMDTNDKTLVIEEESDVPF